MTGSCSLERMAGRLISERLHRQGHHAVGATQDRVAQTAAARQDVGAVKRSGGPFGLGEGGFIRRKVARGQPALRHLPTGHQVARQHQIRHAAREHRIGVGLAVRRDKRHHLRIRLAGLPQLAGHGHGLRIARGRERLFDLAHPRGEVQRQGAAIAHRLASHQIIGLDGRGALVDGENAGVAVILGRPRLFDEAHAAVHLHAQARHLDAHLCRVALDQRHQKLVGRLVRSALPGIGMGAAHVVQTRGHQRECAAAFGERAHGHEHAAHIGVMHDAHRLRRAAVHRARLHSILGIGRRLLVSPLGYGNALQAHGVAGRVHHDEHVFQPAIGLAHQLANRAGSHLALAVAVNQHRRRAGLDTQLVLDGGAPNVVAPPVFQHLEHDEQRNALDPRRRIRKAGQHQVDDVVRHVVLAISDVNFLAEQPVSSVALRLSAAAHQRQIRARLRLGEVHGASPLARDQPGDVALLLRIGTRSEQGFDGAV